MCLGNRRALYALLRWQMHREPSCSSQQRQLSTKGDISHASNLIQPPRTTNTILAASEELQEAIGWPARFAASSTLCYFQEYLQIHRNAT